MEIGSFVPCCLLQEQQTEDEEEEARRDQSNSQTDKSQQELTVWELLGEKVCYQNSLLFPMLVEYSPPEEKESKLGHQSPSSAGMVQSCSVVRGPRNGGTCKT